MKLNIIINLLSKLWTGLIGFLIIPTYVRLLGADQFALVGVYMAMLPVIFLLDGGLGASLNRTFAQLSTKPDSGKSMRDTLLTNEFVFWGVSILIAVVSALCAPFLARYAIHSTSLTRRELTEAIVMMGCSTAILFPFGLYQGGFMGLQKQGEFNAILMTAQTVRVFGILPVFHFYGSTMEVFFVWQIIVTGLQNVLAAVILWRILPKSESAPKASMTVLRSTRIFAVGVFWANVLVTIMSQFDRPVLLWLRPNVEVSYYSYAATGAGMVMSLIMPVYFAAYPKFSELVAREDNVKLRDALHTSSQVMAVLVAPFTAVVAGLPSVFIWAWNGSPIEGHSFALILTMLTIGWGICGSWYLLYALQLAFGWTKLSVVYYLVAFAIQMPLLIILTKLYGGVGAASVWLGFNIVTIIVIPPIMFKRIMTESRNRWYVHGLLLPSITAATVIWVMRCVQPVLHSRLECVGYIAGSYVVCLIATLAVASDLRSQIWAYVTKRGQSISDEPMVQQLVEEVAENETVANTAAETELSPYL